jgi:RHS repeat-associated protein
MPDPAIQNPDTATTYNDAQQLEQIIRPGGDTVTYGYDTGGRLRTITHSPSGDLFTYTVESLTGRLESIEGPTGVDLDFGYLGELLTNETWSGAVSGSVSRTYDVTGRIATQTVAGGETITFGYDDDGLLTSTTSPSATFTINRSQTTGLIDDTALGVVTDTWDFNDFGELRSYEAEDGVDSLYSVDYERDKLGRITRKTETVEGATTVRQYEYDTAGRLERVLDGAGAQLSRYVYDDNGNRLEHRGAGDTLLASGDYDNQDRLKEYGGAEYTYGPNGELQSKTESGQTTMYEYDAFGNLRTVVLPTTPATTIEYLVDGKNRRVGKKVDGALVQQLFYEDQLNPVAWIDDQGDLAQFVYGTRTNVPDYMIKNGVTYRIVSDHLGSVRLVVNEVTGDIVQYIDYDEFGHVELDTTAGFQPFGFAGGIYDVHTGFVRFGARDYDPELARWTTKDALRFEAGSTNLFVYVENDPLNRSDLFGEQTPIPLPPPNHVPVPTPDRPICMDEAMEECIQDCVEKRMPDCTVFRPVWWCRERLPSGCQVRCMQGRSPGNIQIG